MTSVEKPTTALNVELSGKQGCFQLPRLAAIGIHHNGVAPYRQHIYPARGRDQQHHEQPAEVMPPMASNPQSSALIPNAVASELHVADAEE